MLNMKNGTKIIMTMRKYNEWQDLDTRTERITGVLAIILLLSFLIIVITHG